MLLTVSGLTKSFGQNKVLDNVSFNIADNEKIGIVGKNGAGKTTLFNLIANQTAPDVGSIIKPASMSIGMLSQMPSLNLSINAYDNLLTVFDNLIKLEKEISDTEQKIAQFAYENSKNQKLLDKYSELVDIYEKSGGYSYPSQIKGALKGFGFDESEFLKPAGAFSGGQQNKIAFLKLLLSKPDLLLLDEPTNYFDIDTILWLENFLKNYSGAVVAISHDRYFLDAVCEKIFEIDNAKLTIYKGNYTSYIKQKRKKSEDEYNKYVHQNKEIKRQEQIIAQFRQYNREKSIKQAESRQKKLDKIIRFENPKKENRLINISFECKTTSGKKVLELCNIYKSFGSKQIINNFSHTFYKNQKTGIFGQNGIGKSTLLKIISGIDNTYSGEVKPGHNTEIAYSEQLINFKQKTVLDEILYIDNINLTEKVARSYLAMFLFGPDDAQKNIDVLSGGERSRLNLLKTMISGANLILLDEPTNHLDISSVTVLEEALKSYDGTLIIISHDRYFLNNICDNMLVFEDGTIKHYDGNYDYYINYKEKSNINIDTKKQERKKTNTQTSNSKKRISLRIKELENLISKLEKENSEIEILICKTDFYKSENSKDIINNYEITKTLLKEYEDEWLELNDIYSMSD